MVVRVQGKQGMCACAYVRLYDDSTTGKKETWRVGNQLQGCTPLGFFFYFISCSVFFFLALQKMEERIWPGFRELGGHQAVLDTVLHATYCMPLRALHTM